MIWIDIVTALAALCFIAFGYLMGYRSCEKYWRDRAEFITGQREVEAQMARDGWRL
jgi:hypothetical protein